MDGINKKYNLTPIEIMIEKNMNQYNPISVSSHHEVLYMGNAMHW